MTILSRELPIRDIRVRFGSYANCGGVAFATVDVEAGAGPGVEIDASAAQLPDWADELPEDIEICVRHLGIGVRSRLVDVLGAEPAIRVVVRRIDASPVDVHYIIFEGAGRAVAGQIGQASD